MITRDLNVNLDITNSSVVKRNFVATVGDSDTYILNVSMYEGTSVLDLTSASTSIVVFHKADENTVTQGLTVVSATLGTLTCNPIDNNGFSCSGTILGVVQIYGASGQRISSNRFQFSAISSLDINSIASDTSYPILTALIVDMNALIDETNHHGEYVTGTTYLQNNIVSYSTAATGGGGSYMCIVSSTVGNLPTDITKWQLIASKGATGATGVTGVTGITGVTGPADADTLDGFHASAFGLLTGTQTFTNKTYTTPIIINSDYIQDESGNEQLQFLTTTGAINYLAIKNSVTASSPQLQALGDDTNIGLNLVPKGTGKIQANGVEIVTLSSTSTLTNKTLTTPIIVNSGYIADNNANEQLGFVATTGAINYLGIQNSVTGNKVQIQGLGDDTDVGISLQPKGTGTGASVIVKNNTNYDVAQLRNIFISTLEATGGGNGDLWFKYTT